MTATATETTTAVTTWNIDPVHSTLKYDGSDITKSSVEASINVSTITTGDVQRDAHLKSPDFFDAEKFPTLSFKSTRITKKGEEELAVAGDLTIHGVTRNVVFNVEGPSAPTKDPWGNTRVGLSATTKINRKDFGLTWNSTLETGGLLVGEEVSITLEVQFVKA
jgi:polyisoprenoid-binding protein YceI